LGLAGFWIALVDTTAGEYVVVEWGSSVICATMNPDVPSFLLGTPSEPYGGPYGLNLAFNIIGLANASRVHQPLVQQLQSVFSLRMTYCELMMIPSFSPEHDAAHRIAGWR
jgi:hypothetical protein